MVRDLDNSPQGSRGSRPLGDQPKRIAGAFYGRRKTKTLKRSQEILFKELLPRLKLDLIQRAPKKLGTLFLGKAEKIILEIGFGGGEHLVQRAVEHGDNGFIGCEPFINGMAKALSSIDHQQIDNIRLFDEDATRLLDWLEPQSVDLIYLLYPDPWPKRRHWKRRFVNIANLQRFARVLKPAGEVRFASDIAHYVNWTLNMCHDSKAFDWQANSSVDWHRPWPGWQSTRYEAKAMREGRKPAYLTFNKV